MNSFILCLSIVSGHSNMQRTPTPVLEIVQEHIIREIKNQHPEILVNFNVASCPNVAHYEEGISELIIRGNTSTWTGEKTITYNDALSQRALDFKENLTITPIQTSQTQKNSSLNIKKILLWSAVGLIAAGGIYYLNQSKGPTNQDSNTLQTGITF